MRFEMSKLQGEVLSMSAKQGEISKQVGGVEQVVMNLNKQLSTISSVLQSLVKTTATLTQSEMPSTSQQVPKSPTLQQENIQDQLTRSEQLRKQLDLEREKSKQIEDQLQNLPPIRTSRTQAPPGFANAIRTDFCQNVSTPLTARDHVPTPAFNKFYQQNRERQMWQGYHKTYEQEIGRAHV